MTGPRPFPPLPLSDDDYARREYERAALEEAPEVVIELPEFLPISNVDVEKVELDTDYMVAHDNFSLYSEWGVVR